jgi:integrase/recombinase XerC/integrase/recombinase XerD
VADRHGTARLLLRILSGRKSGPLFLTDRKARPSMAVNDVDPTTGRARLSYRRPAELFQSHTLEFDNGPYTLYQLRHSRLPHAAEGGASTPVLMKLVRAYLGAQPGEVLDGLRRGASPVPSRQRPFSAAPFRSSSW